MKLIHLSDLHLGKRVNEFSMLEDQKDILQKCLNIIDAEKPDAVILAGDIYDKSVPPAEAVTLFDDFLCSLAERRLQVFAISGNHDSPERIAFASRLLDTSGIHLSPVYNGRIEPITLEDRFGPVNFWMLPFVKPTHVRRWFSEEEIGSYTDAVRVAVEKMEIDPEQRNVLVTHQFVTGAERSDSEESSVGGSDNVDSWVFDGFDYVALGHIHGPQNIDSERIRYCGTPLKYSFSEASHEKSVTVVELGEKGSLDALRVRTVPLVPKRDLREIRGTYMELTARENYIGTNREDYLHITLTDEEEIPEVMSKLRVIYPNLMKLSYDNRRTRTQTEIGRAEDVERKSPLELFGELYQKQNGGPMSEEQRAYAEELIEKIWEDRA
ncbi:MAG: exonuclease SbcCD subunit D [Oscillospiraceae bacterium]|nr:exonuclease SbcCD subunit D [Oscillospiraceae bacterium]